MWKIFINLLLNYGWTLKIVWSWKSTLYQGSEISAAFGAGFKEGDVILEINESLWQLSKVDGKTVKTVDDLVKNPKNRKRWRVVGRSIWGYSQSALLCIWNWSVKKYTLDINIWNILKYKKCHSDTLGDIIY